MVPAPARQLHQREQHRRRPQVAERLARRLQGRAHAGQQPQVLDEGGSVNTIHMQAIAGKGGPSAWSRDLYAEILACRFP